MCAFASLSFSSPFSTPSEAFWAQYPLLTFSQGGLCGLGWAMGLSPSPTVFWHTVALFSCLHSAHLSWLREGPSDHLPLGGGSCSGQAGKEHPCHPDVSRTMRRSPTCFSDWLPCSESWAQATHSSTFCAFLGKCCGRRSVVDVDKPTHPVAVWGVVILSPTLWPVAHPQHALASRHQVGRRKGH